MSQKIKTSLVLEERHRDWLHSEGGTSETVAILVEQEIGRREAEARAAELSKRKLKPKDRFLEAVAECFHLRRAARMADVKQSSVESWLENEDFYQKVIDRQEEFLEGLEVLIVEAARGWRVLDRSAMQGLIALLTNHSPNWGRGKLEEMARTFGPIFDELLDIVKTDLGDSAYQRIADKFAAVRDAKLSPIG